MKEAKINFKEINQLAIPAIIAGIAEPLISLTDIAIIGNVKSATIYPPHRFVTNICNQVKKININNSLHKKKYHQFKKYFNREKNRFTLPALFVAKKVYSALKSNNPKSQYYVTLPTYILSYSRILPNPIFEKFLKLISK